MTEKATYEELEQTESDLKKSKNALQETEQFLVSIFESIQDGISILNTDCSIRYVNDVMKKWYSEKLPLEGKKCFEAYHDANKPCDHCPTLRCLESGKTEIDIVSGLSGSDVEWIELYSYPIYHAETGKITGIIEFARDITQRKRVEESLLESEERYSTLIDDVLDISSVGTFILDKNFKVVWIADTGKGMNKTLTKKIFDPFFTTKKKGKGTGMGLSVVHGIVISMNGAIQLYSEAGKGTEFNVYLPVEKSLSEKQVTNSKVEIQRGTEQILLVDDEAAILTMEKKMLERLGYQVTSRTSGIEALEIFRDSSNKFDLVITDMAMPNMSGDKLSAKLTKIHPGIPVLLCTGFSETMSEEKAASLGIKSFLLKPIVMRKLSQKIREVLDKSMVKQT